MHGRKRAATTLAGNDNDTALAGLVLCQAAILTVGFHVLRPDMTAEVRTIDLNRTAERVRYRFSGHRLTQLVRENPSRLVLHVQIASELKRRNALGSVRQDRDRAKHVGEAELARSKDRP